MNVIVAGEITLFLFLELFLTKITESLNQTADLQFVQKIRGFPTWQTMKIYIKKCILLKKGICL